MAVEVEAAGLAFPLAVIREMRAGIEKDDGLIRTELSHAVRRRVKVLRNRVTKLSITHKLRHAKSQFDIGESG